MDNCVYNIYTFGYWIINTYNNDDIIMKAVSFELYSWSRYTVVQDEVYDITGIGFLFTCILYETHYETNYSFQECEPWYLKSCTLVDSSM